MPCPRRVVLITILLAVGGCAPVARPTPTGAMWAFFTDADLGLGPGGVVYTSSEIGCETERRRRVDFVNRCVRVVVTPGPGRYAMSLPANLDPSRPDGMTFATVERKRCEWLRSDLFRAYNAMGDCEPVAVQRVP